MDKGSVQHRVILKSMGRVFIALALPGKVRMHEEVGGLAAHQAEAAQQALALIAAVLQRPGRALIRFERCRLHSQHAGLRVCPGREDGTHMVANRSRDDGVVGSAPGR